MSVRANLGLAATLALSWLLRAGCGHRQARGAKLTFEERFDCTPETVEKAGDRWVVTGCHHRAEYECGRRAGLSGDLGYANCHLRALKRPSVHRSFAKGVRVERGADDRPLVRARTGRSSPRIELRASPSSAPDVAVWLVSAKDENVTCAEVPRVWIDGLELSSTAYERSEEGPRVEHRFRTPLSPLRQSAEARRIRVDVCTQKLVLAAAEREVLSDFAMRATEAQ